MGAAVAALGLSNKAIYAAKPPLEAPSAGGDAFGAGAYGEGPDLAPSAAPAATAGHTRMQLPEICPALSPRPAHLCVHFLPLRPPGSVMPAWDAFEGC